MPFTINSAEADSRELYDKSSMVSVLPSLTPFIINLTYSKLTCVAARRKN